MDWESLVESEILLRICRNPGGGNEEGENSIHGEQPVKTSGVWRCSVLISGQQGGQNHWPVALS